jgi:cupin domain
MAKTVTANPESSVNARRFLDGSRRSVAMLPSAAIGWGEYLPGWRWSEHVGKQTGRPSEAHVGYVLSGQMGIQSADGEQTVVRPGDAFEIAAGHDAWVIGDTPCVALDFEHRGPVDRQMMEEWKG